MKKIAIIGTAPSSVRLAPYGATDWEIWACSPGTMGVAPRIDQFFELHRYEPGQPWFSPEYCKFLANFAGPVWMGRKIPEIPNSQVMPVGELISKYGEYNFTSSIAWMFAMAIEAGATTIGMWGVDMAANEEYGYQRSGLQFFAQIAQTMGIEVGVPPESDLLRPPPLYGICEHNHDWIKITARHRELQGRLKQLEVEHRQKSDEILFVKGAIDDLFWNQNTWAGNTDSMGFQYTSPSPTPVLSRLFMSDIKDIPEKKPKKNPAREAKA